MAVAGRILIMPKGEYNPNTTYEMLDVVNHNGISWICKKTSVGITPSEGEHWQALLGIVIANNLTTEDEGNVLDARQGKTLKELIEAKGKFQRFVEKRTFTAEEGAYIELGTVDESTEDLFALSDGYYVAKKDMTVRINVGVYASTTEAGNGRMYVVLMYTPKGGEEQRIFEDVSYGAYTSADMTLTKVVKQGDKFRLLNSSLVEINGGFLSRPSYIEFTTV